MGTWQEHPERVWRHFPRVIGFLMPGEIHVFYAESEPQKIGQALLAKCSEDDETLQVMDLPKSKLDSLPLTEEDKASIEKLYDQNGLPKLPNDEMCRRYLHDCQEGEIMLTFAKVRDSTEPIDWYYHN